MEDKMAKPTIPLPGRSSKPFDPISSLIRRWLEIVVFGGMLAMVLLLFALIASKPYYEVEGMLRIEPVVPNLLAPTEDFSITAYYHDYARTQVRRIKERAVLEKALNGLSPEHLQNFALAGDNLSLAALALGGRLDISRIRDTHLVRVYLKGGKPEGLAEIVNTLMEIYLDKLEGEISSKNNRRLAFLTEEKERLEKEIAQQVLKLEAVVNKTGTSNFSEAFNIYTRSFKDLQGAYARAYENRVVLENAYHKVEAENEEFRKLTLNPVIDELVEKDQSLWDTSFWTYKTLQELRAELDGVTPGNPDRKYIDERMEGMQGYLDKLRHDVRVRATRIVTDKRELELEKKLVQARLDLEAARKNEQEMLSSLERVRAQSVATSGQIFEAQQLNEDLIHLRALLDRTDDRLHMLRLESKTPGRVVLESLARSPEKPAGSNRKKLIALSLMLSFCGITAFVLLFDLVDNRIRHSKDIQNALGIGPTWPISDYLVTGDARSSFHRVTLDDPDNIVAVAIRSLAGRVDMEHRQHQAQVIVFTGVDSCGGTTEVLLNTAHALSTLHERILVVETNDNHANLDELLAIPKNTAGLVEVLDNRCSLAEGIYRDPERDIDVLHLSRNTANVKINASQFVKLLTDVRQDYDLILVDAAPVLASDKTEIALMQADVSIILIQGDRSSYRDLRLCFETFARLRVPAMAAVLNWGAPRHRSKVWVLLSKFLEPLRSRLRKKQTPPSPDEWQSALQASKEPPGHPRDKES